MINKAKHIYSTIKNIINCSNYHANQENWQTLLSKKNSDTLCILATGPSINDLSDEDFKFIDKHDSIGLNLFIAHHYQPTYHQIEFWPQYKNTFLANYKQKYSNKIKEPPYLIINKKHAQLSGLDARELLGIDFCYTNPYRFTGYTIKQINSYLIFYNYILRPLYPNLLVHHGGSLTCAISFGLFRGYKRIIIYGTNLNRRGHFYSTNNKYNDIFSLNYVESSKRIEEEIHKRIKNIDPNPKLHPTINQNATQTYSEHSVLEIIKIFNHIAKLSSCTIEVFNKDSALADILKVYE
jgi:hypothetical protein